jgi:hypothetical protein
LLQITEKHPLKSEKMNVDDQYFLNALEKDRWSVGKFEDFKTHFYTILYENEFQNPQSFQQTISLFPEQSTLVYAWHSSFIKKWVNRWVFGIDENLTQKKQENKRNIKDEIAEEQT